MFSGLGMLIILAVLARRLFGLQQFIEVRHLELLGKLLLGISLLLAFSYATELFMAWYSGSAYDRFAFLNRAFGNYGWAFWLMLACNVGLPQLLWRKAVRTNLWALLAIGVAVSIGMWLERFVIVCTSLSRDFLPPSWGGFTPTVFDVATLAGSFGLFLTLLLLLCRYLPMVAMAEVKALQPGGDTPPHAPEDGS
jgi:hypothetical protein